MKKHIKTRLVSILLVLTMALALVPMLALSVSADSGYTVTLYANDEKGTQAEVKNVSGLYVLPECSFTPPAEKTFKAWAIGSESGEQKKPGAAIDVSENTLIVAIWTDSASVYETRPNGGMTTVNGSYKIRYRLTFQPDTVWLQFYNDYQSNWTDNYCLVTMPASEGALTYFDVPTIHPNTEETVLFRLVAYKEGLAYYSNSFAVEYSSKAFTTQPTDAAVAIGENYTANYAMNFTPETCAVEVKNGNAWEHHKNAGASSVELYSGSALTQTFRIKATIEGKDYYSNEFSVRWSATTGTGSESDPFVVTDYAELRELMANAPTNGSVRYIKLGSNITSADSNNDYSLTLTKAEQKVVLDLNGYSITRNPSVTVDESIIRAKEGTLTINDGEGTGKVYSESNYLTSAIGLLADGLYNDNGTVIINGGEYSVNATVLSYGVRQMRGKLIINGGKFTGKYGLDSNGGELMINGGDFYATQYEALRLSGNTTFKLYNLTAHGTVRMQGAALSLWDKLHSSSEVYINTVKQSKSDTTAFEGDKVEIVTEMVDEIRLTVNTPEIGATPSDSVDIPVGSEYEIVEEYGAQVIAWMNNGQPINGAKFEPMTAYTVRAYVKVIGPAAMDIFASVNNQPAKLEFDLETMEGYRFYWVEYTFEATIDNRLDNISVSITAPVNGETASTVATVTTDNCTASVVWTTEPNGGTAFTGQFVQNTKYYANVMLTAENPYVFVEGASVYVNGKKYTATWVSSGHTTAIQVKNIEFTAPAVAPDEYMVVYGMGDYGQGANDWEYLPDGTEITLKSYDILGFVPVVGFEFDYWSIRKGTAQSAEVAQKQPGDSLTITDNTYIIAMWKEAPLPKYDVVYAPGEGQGSGETASEIEFGSEFTLSAFGEVGLTAPEGKMFDYWSIRVGSAQNPESAQLQAGDKIIINAETYVIAIWKDIPPIMHTVVYCPGEGQGSGDIESIEQGTELTLKTFDEAGLVAPEGKVFDKWSIRHGSVLGAELAAKQAGEKITVSATTYVLAIWKDAPAEHTHAHGSEWKTDANNHWNECECTDKANVGAHADANADGKCDVCAYQMTTTDNSGEGTQNGGNASTETEAPTTDSPADTSEQKSGCGSTVTLSALATVGIIGMALAFKKKED